MIFIRPGAGTHKEDMEMSKFKITPTMIIRFIALGAGTFIYATPYIIWTFYMPLFNAFDVDYARFGLLMTVYGFANLPFYFIGGWIADRFNPAKLVTLSLVASGLLGLIYATLPAFGIVLVIQFLLSVFSVGTYWPAMLKLVKLLSKDLGEGKGYSTWEIFRKFINVGLSALEIVVFTRFGEGQTGLAAALTFNSIVVIVLGGLTWFAYRGHNPNMEIENAEKEKVNLKLVVPLLKKPVIWMIGIVVFCVYGPSAMQGNLSAYSISVMGMSESQGAWLVQVGNLAPLFVLPIAGILADKFGAAKATLIAMFFTLASVLFMIAVPAQAVYIAPALISIVLFLVMIIGVRGVYWALVGWAGIPPLIAGTALGVISFIGFIPDLFIYNLAGSFLDKDPVGGYLHIFYMMAGLIAFGILTIFVMMKYVGRKTPEQLFGDIHKFAKEAATEEE